MLRFTYPRAHLWTPRRVDPLKNDGKVLCDPTPRHRNATCFYNNIVDQYCRRRFVYRLRPEPKIWMTVWTMSHSGRSALSIRGDVVIRGRPSLPGACRWDLSVHDDVTTTPGCPWSIHSRTAMLLSETHTRRLVFDALPPFHEHHPYVKVYRALNTNSCCRVVISAFLLRG
ncbi:hypothetical protein B0H12DRAFT_215887 [Mycena haematopus]|nr:hypothetical protein B0H12DRAFT_215887 [Mycena haematopus]